MRLFKILSFIFSPLVTIIFIGYLLNQKQFISTDVFIIFVLFGLMLSLINLIIIIIKILK